MVSTPEEITDVNTSLPMKQTIVKNQVLVNHRVYSPTYLMLKIELLSNVTELQNQNTEPLNLVVVCGKIKQNEKGIQNQ